MKTSKLRRSVLLSSITCAGFVMASPILYAGELPEAEQLHLLGPTYPMS